MHSTFVKRKEKLQKKKKQRKVNVHTSTCDVHLPLLALTIPFFFRYNFAICELKETTKTWYQFGVGENLPWNFTHKNFMFLNYPCSPNSPPCRNGNILLLEVCFLPLSLAHVVWFGHSFTQNKLSPSFKFLQILLPIPLSPQNPPKIAIAWPRWSTWYSYLQEGGSSWMWLTIIIESHHIFAHGGQHIKRGESHEDTLFGWINVDSDWPNQFLFNARKYSFRNTSSHINLYTITLLILTHL